VVKIGILGEFVTLTVCIGEQPVEESIDSFAPFAGGELVKMPGQEDPGMKCDKPQKV
jgi:hypothetical protein